ncbi:MAG: hypothetical protein GTO41_25355 [Burkholderiales bacterium]|nr:hypothetical protein [Burkholderiales bacterium]
MKTRSLIGVIGLAILLQWFIDAHALAELPDPTRPVFFSKPRVMSAAPVRPELVLQLTLTSPVRQIAIINGRTYSLGASVGGAVITQIKPYEVTLRREGRETRLRFFPRLIEHPFSKKDRRDGKAE